MKTTLTSKPVEGISPEAFFPGIADEPGSVWLDSSLTIGDKGHRSLIATHPAMEVRSLNGRIEVRNADHNVEFSPSDDLFTILDRLVTTEQQVAIGYISYEAMHSLLGLDQSPRPAPIPDAVFYVYDSFLTCDHTTDLLEPSRPDTCDYFEITQASTTSTPNRPEAHASLKSALPYDDYIELVNRVKRHIVEGDIYQANFTCRFDIESQAAPFDVYRRLRRYNPAPYSAFMNFGDFQILSSSPERMFHRRGNHISSCPIKGTIARGDNPAEENVNLKRLLTSTKDRAELLMIVDLVRNDLGKIARTGTVEVGHLFRPETYSSLIHLVADVTAEIPADTGISDICKAVLPGGSVTGAPKRRAVEILNELEPLPRSVYTGCIGYFNREIADFNIAIRTMYCSGNTWHIHAGGGIVADSEPDAEYREMLLKAKNLFAALGFKP